MADDFSTPDSQNFDSSIPAFFRAADNHNLGNTGGGSWFDPSTWDTKLENAGKFITTSVLSGADSLYTSAQTVGNWMGADMQIKDTGAWISSLDADLGQYYSDNRQAVDLAGFVASSFIPGLGGIKILNAGQVALKSAKAAGMFGSNLGLATNLLAPNVANYVKLAGAEIKAAQTVFTGINTTTLKALGAGVQQNFLEGVAFETAVQATMFKSPILSDQDTGDIVKNILIGGAVGGALGGAIGAPGIIRDVTVARKAEEALIKPFSSRELVREGTAPSERIILAADNRESTPGIWENKLPEGSDPISVETYNAQIANTKAAVSEKFSKIDADIRTSIHDMTVGTGNPDLANTVGDSVHEISSQQAMENFLHLKEITKPTVITPLEREAAKDVTSSFYSRWINIAGDDAGKVSYEAPAVMDTASRIIPKAGQTTEDAVLNNVRGYGFKPGDLWNPVKDAVGKLSYREAEARYIWADQILKKVPDIVHENDFPILERALKDNTTDFKIATSDGTQSSVASTKELKELIIRNKENVANDILSKRIGKLDAIDANNSVETTTAAIAKTVNAKQSYLEGTRNGLNPDADTFAWQAETKANHDLQVARGLANPGDTPTPSYFIPKIAKMNYMPPADLKLSGNLADALTWIKTNQKLSQDAADRAVAKIAGDDIAGRMPDISLDKLMKTNSFGSGPGFTSFAQSGYGKPEAIFQYLGGVTKDLKAKFNAFTQETLQGPLVRLLSNQESAIEFERINQQIGRTTEHYVLDTENALGRGTNNLVPKKILDSIDKDTGEIGTYTLQPGAPEFIPIQNAETLRAVESHIALNNDHLSNGATIAAAYGKSDGRANLLDTFRPIRANPKDYPHFAFVKDPRVTGAGHTTMLHAATPGELEELISKVTRDFPEYEVLTKQDTDRFFNARKEYEYDRSLNENYIDSGLQAKGIYSNFFTRTDPQAIADSVLQHHLRADAVTASETLRLKYSDVFNWLEDQGESYAKFASSKFQGGKLETIEQSEKNPYVGYIKTALNINSTPNSNPWYSFNRFLDTQVSRMVGKVREAFDSAKSPADLENVNAILQKYGSSTAFNSSAEAALVNHTAPKAELSKFIRGANTIMSRFVLGLDPLNAINNAVGANVLRGTELTQLTRAINNGNTDLAGELAQLAKVTVPGTTDQILAPIKLIANALKDFTNSDTRAPLLAQFKSDGYIRDRLQQLGSIFDDFTLRGTEGVSDLNTRMARAFSTAKDLASTGENLTGNKLAEEFNRFISAHVMKQITDLAESHGIMGAAEAKAQINLFVNRVEGNTIAAQRPGVFQGPLGQAIGLFQSYQFNIMQQLFRYTAEGSAKDTAMLLGLQGTLYGLQGMPAFKFLNDHVVGTLSGNKDHRDIYDATRGIAGKTAGDWLMYGAASNILQTNLYSRGDINPRSVTVLPTNLSDVPFVGGMAKVFGALKDATSSIAQGGNVWESMLEGIEHNGISRPLAGLATVARGFTNNGQVFSTSSRGDIVGSNDLVSLASLSRLAGGRPMDEAVVNDTLFRVNSYEAVDRAAKQNLDRAIKTTVVGNGASGMGDENSVNKFALEYAKLGGKQGSFAKHMMEQYTNANTPQAQLLAGKLNNPLSYKLQALMGGSEN